MKEEQFEYIVVSIGLVVILMLWGYIWILIK